MMSLALTHFNRYDLLCEAIAQVVGDPRLDEIVIRDDASDDGSWERLVELFRDDPKVRLSRNSRNVDCYVNKSRAIGQCIGEYIILFDSDNVMPTAYLDALVAVAPWDRRTAYLPVFAEPSFDYRAFEGLTIDRHNVAGYMDQANFTTALNTANYLVHRDEYLRAWDPHANPHTSDSIYMNFRWLQAGNALYFVPGLHYFHRLHPGSHFIQNNAKTGAFAREIEDRLRRMR